MGKLLRRIRGAIGNALTWAAAWFGGSLALLGALGLAGLVPPIGLGMLLRLSLNVGITGFLAGTGFSLFLGTRYGNHQLEDLRVGRVALWGTALSGLLAPALSIVTMRFGASGIGLGFLAASAIGAGIFGGLTAGGTIALAQRSARRLGADMVSDEIAPQGSRRSALGGGANTAS
jgi:hypothetical protein